jgi:hypothetical protein
MNPAVPFREALRERYNIATTYKRRRISDEEVMQKADDMLFSRLHRKQEENETRMSAAETRIASLARVAAGGTGLAGFEARMNDSIAALQETFEAKLSDMESRVRAIVEAAIKTEKAAYETRMSDISSRLSALEAVQAHGKDLVTCTTTESGGIGTVHINLKGLSDVD